MSNEDKKPEVTAMQILIDEVQDRINSCEQTYRMQRLYSGTRNKSILRELRSLRGTKAKYIELRDTVEKEQHRKTWIEGFKTAQKTHPWANAEGNYNEKHTNHGK